MKIQVMFLMFCVVLTFSACDTSAIDELDDKNPTLTLYGETDITMYQYDTFENRYEALDAEDGNITKKVEITPFYARKVGDFTLTYTVQDSAKHQVVKTRTIHVLPQDDIRKEIRKANSLEANASFVFWDYLINIDTATVTSKKFIEKKKIAEQEKEIIKHSDDEVLLKLPYTLRQLQYLKHDNNITVNFLNEEEIVKTLILKAKLSLHTSITHDAQHPCKLVMHYDRISLAGVIYDDVLEVDCKDEKEVYYAKYKGLVVENSIEHKPDFFKRENLVENNLKSVTKADAHMLAYAPYFLNGEGITVGVIDGGAARETHQEFDKRVENIKRVDLSAHTSHVVGTIAAKGINKDAKGFASAVQVKVETFEDKYNANAMEYLFDEYGIEITNHSYGGIDSGNQGVYEYDARKADALVTQKQTIIAVKSAGNDRTLSEYSDYSNIKRIGNAKNIITVGSINEDETISYFSSTGPVRNGRVKPDVVAKGYGIRSVGIASDTAYANKSGTSMSAPAVTGVLALMQEKYLQVNHIKMREDIAKAILVNTAKDLGRPGPDGEYGYGLIDALEAIKTIDTMQSSQTRVQTDKIMNHKKQIYTFDITKERKFKATLSWIDPVLKYADIHTDLFVDLDMTLMDEHGNIEYVYSLDADHPTEDATRDGLNSIDNVEQLETTLQAGRYTLMIDASKMPSDAHPYVLVSNMPLGDVDYTNSYYPIQEFETFVYKVLSRD